MKVNKNGVIEFCCEGAKENKIYFNVEYGTLDIVGDDGWCNLSDIKYCPFCGAKTEYLKGSE